MWIVSIAWLYVALMMALAEATSSQGSVLGALITFIFYGLAPIALVMYLLATPARRKARLAAEASKSTSTSTQADAGSLPASDAIAPVREEP